MSENIKVEYTL